MLIRLARLLPEVIEFLKIQHKQELKTDIVDVMFQKRLAFLADIFSHLNELNRNSQGVGASILGLRDKMLLLLPSLNFGKQKYNLGRK